MARRISNAVAVATATLAGLGGGAAPLQRVPEQVPAAATVTIYGREGSFGVLRDAVPSGQSLARRAVPGWGFPPGRMAYRSALASDGTVLMGGRDHGVSLLPPPVVPTAGELVVGAYQPATGAFSTIRMRTTTGRDHAVDQAGRPSAPSIADLEPIAGGAVAFTAWQVAGTADGEWPVFGVLAKTDGRWQVASRWTTAQLHALNSQACPQAGECGSLDEMAGMPQSHDLIVAQFHGGLAALRVTGPDSEGQFSVAILGHYPYPKVHDPSTADPGDFLDIAPLSIQADPTGRLGDERFAVTLQVASAGDRDAPAVVQEFGYDARTGAIRAVSAPLIPGDRNRDGAKFLGYSLTLYDSQGNLWVARTDGLASGKLAVYAAGAGVRKPAGAACRYDPKRPMDSYTTTAAGHTVWGRGCPPDYDILQAQSMLGVLGMVEDPTSHDIVALHFDGSLLPIRPSGSGSELRFQIGNLVDLGRRLLPGQDTDFPDHRLAGVDGRGRLWVTRMQGRPDGANVSLDQWLYSVNVADLFEPLPVRLPSTSGRTVTIQAEHTATTSTRQLKGAWAAVDVDSPAYAIPCSDVFAGVGCASDGVPGEGFVLADFHGFGHLDGDIEYRVSVAEPGRYRLAYRVATFEITTGARIRLTAGDQTFDTPVSTGGGFRTVWRDEPIELAAGVQRLRLSVPDGGGGWYLNSFTLKRI